MDTSSGAHHGRQGPPPDASPPPPGDEDAPPPSVGGDDELTHTDDLPGGDRPGKLGPPPRRRDRDGGNGADGSRRGRRDGDLAAEVRTRLRRCVAALHGAPVEDAARELASYRDAERVWRVVGEHGASVWTQLFELLAVEIANREGGALDLDDLPACEVLGDDARAELDAVRAARHGNPVRVPASEWFAINERIARGEFADRAERLARSARGDAPSRDLIDEYKALPPPTTLGRATAGAARVVETAAEVAERREREEARDGADPISSGLRSLDIAMTPPGDPLGFLYPGEGVVFAGLTGTGKSSQVNTLLGGMQAGLYASGRGDQPSVLTHTEEESHDRLRAAGMLPGGRLSWLGDRVYAVRVNTSREMLAMAAYDLARMAEERSFAEGRPPRAFAPAVWHHDYIQALAAPGESESVATYRTAMMLLYGIQAWNPDEIAKWSGVDYREYTGRPWPEGMEGHRVAGVYYAQFRKVSPEELRYDPARHAKADFTQEDAATGGWLWEPRPGDLRVMDMNQIRGHGQIQQNADYIVGLHRSRPYENPAVESDDGARRLADTRARLLIMKARSGTRKQHVPMRFDLTVDGFRARYYDHLAEQAIAEGRFTPHEIYTGRGDPILPRRRERLPLAGVSYLDD